jgi:hypothetical protein
MRKIAARMPTGTARGSQANSVKRSERRFMICTFFLLELSDVLSLVYRRWSKGKFQWKKSSSSTTSDHEPLFGKLRTSPDK